MIEQRISVIDRLRIFTMRGQAVVPDGNLAAIYGVSTSGFNKAIARNRIRFLVDFCFQLDAQEFAALRFQIGTSKYPGGRRKVPWGLTEHSAIMAATMHNGLGLAESIAEAEATGEPNLELLG